MTVSRVKHLFPRRKCSAATLHRKQTSQWTIAKCLQRPSDGKCWRAAQMKGLVCATRGAKINIFNTGEPNVGKHGSQRWTLHCRAFSLTLVWNQKASSSKVKKACDTDRSLECHTEMKLKKRRICYEKNHATGWRTQRHGWSNRFLPNDSINKRKFKWKSPESNNSWDALLSCNDWQGFGKLSCKRSEKLLEKGGSGDRLHDVAAPGTSF